MNRAPSTGDANSSGSGIPGLGMLGPRTGAVADYDPDAGIGFVESDGGAWLFHCTTISDGSRQIEPGTPVRFDVRAGGPGRWEAFDVAAIGPPND